MTHASPFFLLSTVRERSMSASLGRPPRCP